MHMCVCVCVRSQQVPKQQVVSRGRSIEFKNLVCCSRVAAALPLTLLRTNKHMPNMHQKCVCLCVREAREDREKRMKTCKLLTHGAKIPSTSIPSPHSSPLLGSQGLRQPGCLPEGQSHSGPVIAAALWCLCGETPCLMSTLINFVNDRSMWACRTLCCLKITAYLPFWVWVWTGLGIALNKHTIQRETERLFAHDSTHLTRVAPSHMQGGYCST